MGSKDKYFGIQSNAHGFDDIGFAQPTGSISSVAQYKTGKWAKYAVVTSGSAHNLTKGQSINITGTTDYDGPTRVIEVLSSTTFVIKRGYTTTKTGAWDCKQAIGAWDALMAIGGGASGANMTIEYHDNDFQGGKELANDFTQNVVVPMPGVIKKITLATAGNIRLFRSSTDKPYFSDKNKLAPSVVGYLPTSAAVGATIDIIGTNFDPVPDRNSVTFFNGVKANVTAATEEILTVTVPSSAAATGVVSVKCNGYQNASGPVFTVNS